MKRGFSLVELSIVLVILGLLTGGILAGQSLINAAALRSVTTEYNSYMTAVNNFRDRYFALPGDFANGQSIWGVADPTPSTCFWTATTDGRTCNGDGNGVVYTASNMTSNERFRFWQQLVSAGLLSGNYNGASVSSVAAATSLNSPVSKFKGGLWFLHNMGTTGPGDPSHFDGIGILDNCMLLGAPPTPAYMPQLPLFTAAELWNIDTKMDDGKPATGKIVVQCYGGLSTCTTATGTTAAQAATLTADYLLTGTDATAALLLPRPF